MSTTAPPTHATSLRSLLRSIARRFLDALPPAALGRVVLRDDQRRLVARARAAIARDGGCLLAEEPGSGKTYVSLALARGWRAPLFVIPASLRDDWRIAMTRAGVSGHVVTHEALSRGEPVLPAFDGVVVDESHHFRTMDTRRHERLCRIAARVPVVLLSATPLQNRNADLATQLAVFLGERALMSHPSDLARWVLRGASLPANALPNVAAPEWLRIDADDSDVLRAILALPPPPRALDAGDAGALRTLGLVRAWSSSRAALVAHVRGRQRIAAAIEQGLCDGRLPTRRELNSWNGGHDAVQLGFASLLMHGLGNRDVLDATRAALEEERVALEKLLQALRTSADPDAARAQAIRRVRREHPGERVLVFSERAHTVAHMFARLVGDGEVGMLTATHARIASGRIARGELLARFAPQARGGTEAHDRERVTLLLSTDLLSEGVNLQDASVVVHLDLPWNPQRLAQRVGRVRRVGGRAEVHAYLLAPPADADTLMRAELRLREKLRSAAQVIGASFAVLPALSPARREPARSPDDALHSARDEGAFVATLARWASMPDEADAGIDTPEPANDTVIECHVDGRTTIISLIAPGGRAWLALLDDGRLVAAVDDAPPDTDLSVRRAVSLLDQASPHAITRRKDATHLVDVIAHWRSAESLALACGATDGDRNAEGPLRRTITRDVARLVQRTARHERASALAQATTLRRALRRPLPLGIERELVHALHDHADDDAPLSRLGRAVAIVACVRREEGAAQDFTGAETPSMQKP